MIHGVGIDLVEIARIETMLARWPERFVRRVFTAAEIVLCENRGNRASAYAARFAAKEAFSKALGTGVSKDFSWQDFAVCSHDNGSPRPVLSPRLTPRLEGCKVHVSLSHAEHYATAVVILEK